MTKKKVIWSGIFSIIPLLFVIIIVGSLIFTFVSLIGTERAPGYFTNEELLKADAADINYTRIESLKFDRENAGQGFMRVAIFLKYALILGALNGLIYAFFLRDLFTNPFIKEKNFTVWALALVFAGIIAYPIYWFKNILKAEGAEPDGGSSGMLPTV